MGHTTFSFTRIATVGTVFGVIVIALGVVNYLGQTNTTLHLLDGLLVVLGAGVYYLIWGRLLAKAILLHEGEATKTVRFLGITTLIIVGLFVGKQLGLIPRLLELGVFLMFGGIFIFERMLLIYTRARS